MAETTYSGHGAKKLTAQVRFDGGVNIETLTGAKTLTNKSANFHAFDGGVADRVVTLPTGTAEFAGTVFWFANVGTTNKITIKNAAVATILDLVVGASGAVGMDGNGVWKLMQTAIASPTDFGAPGMKADVIAESTATAGVTIDGLLLKDGDIHFVDSDKVFLGTSDDVSMTWDGTDFKMLPAADDSVANIGNGTLSFDLNLYGNIPTALVAWDASANELRLLGPVRPTGFNHLSRRFELRWIAGQRGKPGLNADIQAADEATRMIADPDFELLGTNAVSTCSAFGAEGGVVLTTTAAAGDQVILVPHLDASQSAWKQVTWGTDKETKWECHVATGASIVDAIIYAGLKLTNTDVIATDNDQVFFRYEEGVNTGKWVAVDSIANTDVSTDSGVTVVLSTAYHLKITIDSSRIARMYIDGVLVRTTTALSNTTDLIPYIGVKVQAGGADGAKACIVYGQAISRVMG